MKISKAINFPMIGEGNHVSVAVKSTQTYIALRFDVLDLMVTKASGR